MGCHRGITNSPNRGFFPSECVRQNPSLITRTAPRAPYGHRRDLCVVIFARLCPLSVTFRATCLAAARSRSGSDNHSDCHSRPSRRFATREWEAYRITSSYRTILARTRFYIVGTDVLGGPHFCTHFRLRTISISLPKMGFY